MNTLIFGLEPGHRTNAYLHYVFTFVIRDEVLRTQNTFESFVVICFTIKTNNLDA